jgi:hypothetical protein
MKNYLSRREFLKLSGASLGGLAFAGRRGGELSLDSGDLARVTTGSVSVYEQPSDKSKIVCQRFRDEVINVYYEVESEDGPGYKQKWYRVWRGYIHSAYLHRVHYRLNPLVTHIPEKGLLAEVSVPYTQAMRVERLGGEKWTPVYRLYCESNHWIMGVDTGPDGEPWYRVKDELLRIEYHVKAQHLRPITAAELTPISPHVPPGQKRIEVSIARQTVTCFEGDKQVFHTRISSGVPDPRKAEKKIPTDTPTGTFHIQSKVPSKHMGDGNLTADLDAYELPGVPWVSFFEPVTGVAFHGTYWHDNFGLPMSHGCINMRTEEARWIYRWSTPAADINDWARVGYGTLVNVT